MKKIILASLLLGIAPFTFPMQRHHLRKYGPAAGYAISALIFAIGFGTSYLYCQPGPEDANMCMNRGLGLSAIVSTSTALGIGQLIKEKTR